MRESNPSNRCTICSLGIFWKERFIPLKVEVQKFDHTGKKLGEMSSFIRPHEELEDCVLPKYITKDILEQAPASFLVAYRVEEFVKGSKIVNKSHTLCM